MSDVAVKFLMQEDGITNFLSGMLARVQDMSAFLNRYAYPRLIQMQRHRWQTENDGQWTALKPEYAKQKLKKYESFPGSGTKMLIGTGQLVNAVTGDDTTFHRKIVQGNTLTIAITAESSGSKSRAKRGKRRGLSIQETPPFTYPGFVNEKRNFTDITPEAIQDINQALQKYVSGES